MQSLELLGSHLGTMRKRTTLRMKLMQRETKGEMEKDRAGLFDIRGPAGQEARILVLDIRANKFSFLFKPI